MVNWRNDSSNLDDFPFNEIMDRIGVENSKVWIKPLLREMIKLIFSDRIRSLKLKDAVLIRNVLNVYAEMGCIRDINIIKQCGHVSNERWFNVVVNGFGYDFNWMENGRVFVTMTGIVDYHIMINMN